MKRKDFQELAAIRLKEARVLFDAGCFEGAYYLAGYAVECALKSSIAKHTERFEFPDKKKVDASYTHRVDDLIGVAELRKAVTAQASKVPRFAEHWLRVTKWSEHSRYEKRSKEEAEALLNALEDEKHGVLRWLKKHW